MDIPRHQIEQLAELSDALDEDGTDLQAVLSVLVDDLTTAVPSFLGLTMTFPPDVPDGEGVTLNFLPAERADAVSTTLMVPLQALGVSGAGGTVVFYAGRLGAFVDLAVDTRLAYGIDGQVRLDQHLPSANLPPGVFGHTAASKINRAIGVLLGRGHTPEEARSVLHRRANQDRVALDAVAQQLLDTLAG